LMIHLERADPLVKRADKLFGSGEAVYVEREYEALTRCELGLPHGCGASAGAALLTVRRAARILIS